MEFRYNNVSESSINITYNYGNEDFNFNLYMREGYWILHPFDGILLGNKPMSKLVMSELFKNKAFQVMLAKERIPFSILRTSIDLEDTQETDHYEDNRIDGSRNGGNSSGDLAEFIEQHTLEEIIQLERSNLEQKISLYKDILQMMFMNNLGPSDMEFQKIQRVVHIYEEALHNLDHLNGPHYDFRNNNRF